MVTSQPNSKLAPVLHPQPKLVWAWLAWKFMTNRWWVWLSEEATLIYSKKSHQAGILIGLTQWPTRYRQTRTPVDSPARARCQTAKRRLSESFRHQMTPLTGWHTPALPMPEP